ncbi:MAG: hypothetical protein KC506_00115, partial [Nanoarchaeota archaeon]|nr:hypothetical protein [Nanoarchaeota archaeon]
ETQITIEEIMGNAKYAGKIVDYSVNIIDLSRDFDPDILEGFGNTWDFSGNNEGYVNIPIFNNLGNYGQLPQIAFDLMKPGIFTLSQDDYDRVANISKRNTYDILRR